jgi:hypothetical protein
MENESSAVDSAARERAKRPERGVIKAAAARGYAAKVMQIMKLKA